MSSIGYHRRGGKPTAFIFKRGRTSHTEVTDSVPLFRDHGHNQQQRESAYFPCIRRLKDTFLKKRKRNYRRIAPNAQDPSLG